MFRWVRCFNLRKGFNDSTWTVGAYKFSKNKFLLVSQIFRPNHPVPWRVDKPDLWIWKSHKSPILPSCPLCRGFVTTVHGHGPLFNVHLFFFKSHLFHQVESSKYSMFTLFSFFFKSPLLSGCSLCSGFSGLDIPRVPAGGQKIKLLYLWLYCSCAKG